MDSIAVKVEHVSKKFSRYLFQAMAYGVQDIAKNLIGMGTKSERLRKAEFWAVDDVSFEIKRGETLGIIGPNGSGKSTLLKMLNGIYMPDRGRIEISGRTGALIEVAAGFHPMLTGRENIYLNGAILKMSKREIDERFDSIVDFAGIGDFIDTSVKFYSSGMFVRLGFAIAIHCEPDILLVDEILAVGDAVFRAKSARKIRELIEKGASLVFISHNMHLVSSICERVLVLEKGKNIYLGPTDSAIQLYERSFLETQLAQVHNIDQTVETDVKISSIKLLDDSGNPVAELGTDEPLTINVVLESSYRVEAPIFGVRMWRMDGKSCWIAKSNFYGFQSKDINGEYSFECKLTKVQVAKGTYYFTVTVFDGATMAELAKATSPRFSVDSYIPLAVDGSDIYHPLLEWRDHT